jgi:hypothetical protein
MATLSTWLLIPMVLNGTATAIGTTHGNSWTFAIAVLLWEHVLGGMLLGSFHWWSNEEIPTLTLMVWSFCIERDHSKPQQSKNHFIFLCKLVCGLLNQWMDARGPHWLIL